MVTEKQRDSDILVDISEAGVRQLTIGADDAADLSAARRLLARVAPELRALDKALREPERNDGGAF